MEKFVFSSSSADSGCYNDMYSGHKNNLHRENANNRLRMVKHQTIDINMEQQFKSYFINFLYTFLILNLNSPIE